ncbi:DUF808 family protein, partial [Pseudomonas aeruginosa]
VYGLVAGIVKLDDAGLYLSRRDSGFAQGLGGAILRTAPYLMKGLFDGVVDHRDTVGEDAAADHEHRRHA